MSYRLGVDVGGTFTDLLLISEETGETFTAKVPSTPEDSSIGVLNGVARKVAAHAILGLPGETGKDFQQTADTLAALPLDAVKIHNLHIEKGTTLALEHALTPLPIFMEHDFAEHLMDFIRRLPANMPIMRLTTDTLDEELIAPKWNMGKGQFKDYVIQQMTCREWKQGDLYNV